MNCLGPMMVCCRSSADAQCVSVLAVVPLRHLAAPHIIAALGWGSMFQSLSPSSLHLAAVFTCLFALVSEIWHIYAFANTVPAFLFVLALAAAAMI